MTKVKYNHSFGLKCFFKYFEKRKVMFPKSYFFGIKTRKRKLPIDWILFRKTISTYLDIYFKEFYSSNNELYFFLTGELTKARGKGIYKNKYHTNITDSIILVWLNRPSIHYYNNVGFIKLKGSTSRIGRLEKEYKSNFDSGILPSVNQVIKTAVKEKKLYKS